jgi:tyrosine-protein phosphatase non-receptor type 11
MLIFQMGRFDLGGGDSFNSLAELLQHYTLNPLVETNGRVVRIITVSRSVF